MTDEMQHGVQRSFFWRDLSESPTYAPVEKRLLEVVECATFEADYHFPWRNVTPGTDVWIKGFLLEVSHKKVRMRLLHETEIIAFQRPKLEPLEQDRMHLAMRKQRSAERALKRSRSPDVQSVGGDFKSDDF